MLTTKQAAKRLGITVRRVQALIETGKLDAEKPGRDWMITQESVDRRFFVQQAQHAWALIGIPPRYWSTWWLDIDEVDAFPCPKCEATAFSPVGDTQWSGYSACPTCEWVDKSDVEKASE